MTTSLAIATTIVSVWMVEGRAMFVRRIVGAVGMQEDIRVRVLRAVLLEVGLIVEGGNGNVVQEGDDMNLEQRI
jgi:uncharacterized membrane protein